MSGTNREYQKAIDYLADQIKAGKLSVGSRLPTERAIAEDVGISRNSTREALRSLENMGMIESIQGSGNYLTGSISKSLSSMIRMLLLLKKTNPKEICAVRRTLEKSVCNAAIQQDLSPGWLEQAEWVLDSPAADLAEEIENDRKFHYLLVEASQNRLWMELMNAIMDVYREWIDLVLHGADAQTKGQLKQAHRDILEAIIAKDREKCEQAIERHYDIIDRGIALN